MSSVLHVGTSAFAGGAARAMMLLHLGLRTRGRWKSDVLSGRGGTNAARGVTALGQPRLSVALNALSYRIAGVEGPFNMAAWRRRRDLVDSADVLHLHNAHGYYLPYRVLDELLAKPAVWTLHDYHIATGGTAYPPPPPTEGAQAAVSRYPLEWRDRSVRRGRYFRELIARRRPLLVAPTVTMRNELLGWGLPADLLHVVPHGLFDINEPAGPEARASLRARFGWPDDQPVLLFAAAQLDNPTKGLSTLLDAISRALPRDDWRLLLAGDRAPTLPGDARISCVGPLAHPDLLDHMLAADIAIVPSVDETFGLVAVEALAQGALTICSDIPVLAEVSGGEALLFARGNAARLSDAIAHALLRFPEPYAARRDRAQRIRRSFETEAFVQRHEALYEQAMSAAQATGSAGTC